MNYLCTKSQNFRPAASFKRPLCHSTCLSLRVSATLMLNISETERFKASCPIKTLQETGFYPGINMRGCESQGVAKLRPEGPKPEARRAEGGWGSWGGEQRAPSSPAKGSEERRKLPQRDPGRSFQNLKFGAT